ncbi:hypothetical protein Dimus_035440 [Dionaea muscipula]
MWSPLHHQLATINHQGTPAASKTPTAASNRLKTTTVWLQQQPSGFPTSDIDQRSTTQRPATQTTSPLRPATTNTATCDYPSPENAHTETLKHPNSKSTKINSNRRIKAKKG